MNASPTRLLHITTVPFSLFFFRGQPRFMRSKGVDFRILTSPGEELDEFVRREEVDVYPIPMERRITPFKDLAAVLRIARTIRGLRPDIVHAHTPKGGLLGMIAAWLTRVPVRIYHIRGLPYTIATGRKRALMMWTERISCMLAHDVLCVSHSIREIAVRDGICPPDKVKVLLGGSGNGVDAAEQFHPDRFQADDRNSVREKLGIAPDNLVVSYIGRIVKDKGIDELASAWRVIRDRFRDAHLVLVGPVEPQDPVSPELLAQLQSDNRVHFLPRV